MRYLKILSTIEKIPKWSFILNSPELEWEQEESWRIEREWKKSMVIVRKNILEFVILNKKFLRACQKRFIENKQNELKQNILNDEKYLSKLMTSVGNIDKKEKLLDNINQAKKNLNNTINDQDIELARNYDITKLINTNNNHFAICPFHNDTTPSFYIKNNYGYCFSCNESADSIKLYQRINNCTFKDAVIALS